jgi:hypothetical protein
MRDASAELLLLLLLVLQLCTHRCVCATCADALLALPSLLDAPQ